MPSVVDASKNLKKLDAQTTKAVLVLYNEVNELLKKLILDDSIGLRRAQAMLTAELDKAIVSTNFIPTWKAGVIDTIVSSSYVATTVRREELVFTEQLLGTSLFPDKIKLSPRIRRNGNKIIAVQKKVLKEGLKQGRTVTQIARDINKGFKGDITNELNALAKSDLVTPAQIRRLKSKVGTLKTESLRKNYLKLIDTIDLGGNVDKAMSNAMTAKTRYLSQRVARSETIRTLSEIKNQSAVDDPLTQWVKNVTSGANPCPYCIGVERLGFVPVENATIATHHSNCSCSPRYRKSSKKPKKWSNETYISRLETEINKANKENQALGLGKTYIKPDSPTNLRNNTLNDKLDKAKPVDLDLFINK